MIERLGGREVYRNTWLSLREDQVRRADGSGGIYSVVDKPPMAIVLALDDNALDGPGVWLVEQYRYTLGRRVWELPQGAYEQGPDLAPEDLARRELREETGLRAGRVDKLAQLSVARFGIDRFEWMLREGEIVDSLTHATYSLHLMRK